MLDARVVIVSYRSKNRLEPLLRSLAPQVREIDVVDNASGDGSADLVERVATTSTEGSAGASARIRLHRRETNGGFSAGANDGARDATTGWLVFVNPDVHLHTDDLERLLDARGDATVDVLAPLQTDADARVRSESGGYDLTLARLLVWALLPIRWHGRLGPWLAPPPTEGEHEVDWVSGAVMAVRTDRFRELGGFDERYFLYLEDADLCRRIREAGGRVVLRANIHVFHELANGDQRRRADAARRWVAALAVSPVGHRRRMLGGILMLGFGLRAIAGRPGALPAARRAMGVLLSRW